MHVHTFPFNFLWDERLAAVYSFPNLGLKGFGGGLFLRL